MSVKHAYGAAHNSVGADEQKLIFLHIPKSAGLSFDALLRAKFAADQICPERNPRLRQWPSAQLDSFRFFSGHEYFQNRAHIPGEKDIVTLLRHPVDRLISTYTYLRSHSWAAIDAGNLHPHRLAKFLSFKDYLKADNPDPVLPSDNLVTRYLSGLSTNADGRPWRDDAELLDAALANLATLRAVGITEHFDESVAHIFEELDFAMPTVIGVHNATRDNHQESPGWFEPPEPLEIDDETEDLLAHATRLDRIVYETARAAFRARVAPRPRKITGFGHSIGRRLERFRDTVQHAEAGEGGYLLFGPYTRLLKGSYTLHVALDATAYPHYLDPAETLAAVDVVSAQGTQVHATRILRAGDFPSPGWQRLDIPFTLSHTTDRLEMRVWSSGRTALTLDLDIRLSDETPAAA